MLGLQAVSGYLDQSIAKLKEFEGSVGWMYRDTAGKVTVGVGLMLPNVEAACALPFMVAGSAASVEQIGEEFARVAALPLGKAAGFYRRPGSPELAQETIDAKLESVLVEFEGRLRAKLAGYDKLPDGVKMAMLDMAYNLGPAGLLEGYPRLLHAVETGAWSKAAAECAREGIGEARNAWARQQFLSAVVATIRAEAEAEVAAEAEAMEEQAESWFGKLRRELRKPLWRGKK
jgi:GH24 family phage-related lysozyme (muramidase)